MYFSSVVAVVAAAVVEGKSRLGKKLTEGPWIVRTLYGGHARYFVLITANC